MSANAFPIDHSGNKQDEQEHEHEQEQEQDYEQDEDQDRDQRKQTLCEECTAAASKVCWNAQLQTRRLFIQATVSLTGHSTQYKCPKCGRQTCSLQCVRKHKQESGCSGVRDATAFVPLAQYSMSQLTKGWRLDLATQLS
eukprot:jgi/Hompol1/3567/HPOL_001620-RA